MNIRVDGPDPTGVAVITRASPARLLGLKNKGHLGVGADADITL